MFEKLCAALERQAGGDLSAEFLLDVGGLLDVGVLGLALLVESVLKPLDLPFHFGRLVIFLHDGLSEHE